MCFPHLSICRGVGALRVSATSQFSPLIHMLTSSSEVAVGNAQEWEEGTHRFDHQSKPLGTILSTLYVLFLASSPFW